MSRCTIHDVALAEEATVAVPPRDARLPELVGLRRELGQSLDALDVWVIGAGGVGLHLCAHAAQLQVGSLTIVDPGRFKSENLITQRITPHAVGCSKAEYAGRWCQALSPRTRVRVFAGRAEELPLAALGSAQLVMLATDNLTAEVEVGQRCLHAGVPLIQASVGGEMLVAQVRVWGHRHSGGPCLACGFGPQEWAHVNRETIFSCLGGVGGDVRPQPAHRAATRSVGFLCSLAADLAAVQMLRLVGGLGGPVVDTMLEYCGYTHRTVVSGLGRNARCRCEHRRWRRRRLPRRVTSYTPREIAALALGEWGGSPAGVSLAIERMQFCEAGLCTACRRRQAVNRFVTSLRRAGTCAACGAAVDGLPFRAHRPVPLAVLTKQLNRPLAEFIEDEAEAVIVRGPEATVLCEYGAVDGERPGENQALC